jgi:DNA-binding response OmpR family regulator
MSILKIGVVEDELVIARTIISTLDELSYTHCGPCHKLYRSNRNAQQNKPDLVLLDIQLSGKKMELM